MKRFAINSVGRIVRLIIREYLRRMPEDLQLVALNGLTDRETLAYFLEYNSVHGRLAAPVETSGDQLSVSGVSFPVCRQPDPGQLPWSDLAVDWGLGVRSHGRIQKARRCCEALSGGGHCSTQCSWE